MQVHSGTSSFNPSMATAITIGTYDGVHLGHAEIIRQLISTANERQLQTVVLTFHPHPRMIVRTGDENLGLITTIKERIEQLELLGVDHLVVQPFDEEFSRLTPFEFVRDVLVRDLNADTLIVGHDHRFGRNREGNFQTLSEMSDVFGFTVQEIAAQVSDGIRVSSTRIRKALSQGEMDVVERFLGRKYTFSGEVVHGDGRGRSIGFPTMNMRCDQGKMLPSTGVYAVRTQLAANSYWGVMNIGKRPTLTQDESVHVEVHLPEFSGSAYGLSLTIEVNFRLRDEMKFDSVEELKTAIKRDIERVRRIQ